MIAPAASRVITTINSQVSARNDERLGVSRPPSERSTALVSALAVTVGTQIKNTPCAMSDSRNCELNSATPVSAATTRANPRLVYHRGVRKMNRDSPARLPCVVVIDRTNDPSER
jgi:hypothetical protein